MIGLRPAGRGALPALVVVALAAGASVAPWAAAAAPSPSPASPASASRGASPRTAPTPSPPAMPRSAAAPGDWPTYLHDAQRSSAISDPAGGLTPATAPSLGRRWATRTGGAIVSSPAVVAGRVYIGSGDGYEYALDAATGAVVWKTFLGVTNIPSCFPPSLGISSAATVQDGVAYVGGGDAYWYALDAGTGAVLWRVFTGDNSPAGGHYNWASPLIANGFAYVGISSLGDCPLVQGQLLQIDLSTRAVVHTFNVVPTNEVGGGIWTSPAMDTATGTVYVTTGTQQYFGQARVQSLIALNASDLALRGWWEIPSSRAVVDSDWGNSPILFTDTAGRRMVAAINKDGYAYAFDRDNVGAGPVWDRQVAYGGICPTCGDGSVSSGAFDGSRLYFAGENTTINGSGVRGSVRALDPATGTSLWEHGTTGIVVPAIAYASGLVIDAADATLEVLDAATGARLYAFTTGSLIYGAPSVANGAIFVGSTDGFVYALAPGGPPPPPPDPACPPGWTCQDVGAPATPGSESVSGSTWTLTGAGTGIGGTADQFRYVWRPAGGDGGIVARLRSVPSPGSAAQAGVMVRQGADPGSPFYAVLVGPNGMNVQYRLQPGGVAFNASNVAAPPLPASVAVVRTGDLFQAAISTDGSRFTLVPGGDVLLPLPAGPMQGVVTSSRAPATPARATFTSAAIAEPGLSPAPVAAASPCPGWSCADVGNPGVIGDQTLASGAWTVRGPGTDIDSYSDMFHYVWRALDGDWTLDARVTAQTATSGGAKAGIMARQSASDAGSLFYGAFVEPNGRLVVLDRPGQGRRVEQRAVASLPLPASIRVIRTGDAYCTYTATGGGPWTYVPGSCELIETTGPMLVGMAVTSGLPGVIGSATFDSVAFGSDPPPAPTICPAGWSCSEVGYPTPEGSQSLKDGTWTILAGGSDIWFNFDQFRYVWQPLPADGGISARVVTQQSTDLWAKAGVMLRQGMDPASPFYAVYVTPGNGVSVQLRSTQGSGAIVVTGVAGTAPARVRVTRAGSMFCAYTSADGVSWSYVPGSCRTIAMAGAVMAGMVATSHLNIALSTVTVDSVELTNEAPPSPTGCPTTEAWTCADLGDPQPAGTQAESGGTWTITAGGVDIWNRRDEFHLISRPVLGDGTVSARVVSQTNTDPWAKAGVMLRQSSDPVSPWYGAFVTPANGFVVQFRAVPGGPAVQAVHLPGSAPAYVRVARSGDAYCAYTSSDGSSWQFVRGSCETLSMPGEVLGGLAATSHNRDRASTVVFDSVALGDTAPPSPTQCPGGWTCADVGGAFPSGDQALNIGTWTINGGGGDVWGTSDQFHFISQQMAGDGGVKARVVGQSDTDPWAKAGVMIRQSSEGRSPYYAAFVTPEHGVVVQFRATAGGVASQVVVMAGHVPAYLKVGMVGDQFTTFTSVDGATWTPVTGSTVTISMAGPVLAGLAVTSHNTSLLCGVTMDAAALTPPTVAVADAPVRRSR